MKKQPVTLQGQPVGRIKAGWLLFKETWRFLMLDKELLWVPIITSALNILLFGTLFSLLIIVVLGGGDQLLENDVFLYAILFAIYVIGAFTLALAQAATANTVYVRAHGGDATLVDSLKAAFSHWFSLFLWSCITATVGVLLRWLSDRSRLLGKLVAALLGAGWAVLTYFVVPSMVIGKQTAFSSIGDSAKTFKETWGETLVSNISYGFIFLLINLFGLLSFGGLAVFFVANGLEALAIVPLVCVLLWLLLVGILGSAMNSILRTLLYIYAREQVIPQNFNSELLEKMLAKKTPDTPIPAPTASPIPPAQ